MTKPKNPYKRGTLIWALLEDDWSDLNVYQIAETLGYKPNSVRCAMYEILKDTGYRVQYARLPGGVKQRIGVTL